MPCRNHAYFFGFNKTFAGFNTDYGPVFSPKTDDFTILNNVYTSGIGTPCEPPSHSVMTGYPASRLKRRA